CSPSSPPSSPPLRPAAAEARASASLAASRAATRSSVRSLTCSVTASLALVAVLFLELRNVMRPSFGLVSFAVFACAYPLRVGLHLGRDRRGGELDQG